MVHTPIHAPLGSSSQQPRPSTYHLIIAPLASTPCKHASPVPPLLPIPAGSHRSRSQLRRGACPSLRSESLTRAVYPLTRAGRQRRGGAPRARPRRQRRATRLVRVRVRVRVQVRVRVRVQVRVRVRVRIRVRVRVRVRVTHRAERPTRAAHRGHLHTVTRADVMDYHAQRLRARRPPLGI